MSERKAQALPEDQFRLGRGLRITRRSLLASAGVSAAAYSASRSLAAFGLETRAPHSPVPVGVSGDFVRLSGVDRPGLRSTLAALSSSGIRLVRFPVSWASVRPDRFSYDWRGIDDLYVCLAWHGLLARPVIIDWPLGWLQGPENPLSGRLPQRVDRNRELASFACELIARLSRAALQVGGVELWVGSNSRFDSHDVGSYAAAFNGTTDAVEENFPEMLDDWPVVAGGFSREGTSQAIVAGLKNFDPRIALGLQVPPLPAGAISSPLPAALNDRVTTPTIGLTSASVGSGAAARSAIRQASAGLDCESLFLTPVRSDLVASIDAEAAGASILDSRNRVRFPVSDLR